MSDKYPEHEKLRLVMHRTEIINEFLEWCREQSPKYKLVYFLTGTRDVCLPRSQEIDQLLARFIDVDLEKLEKEKVQMLNKMRAMNNELSTPLPRVPDSKVPIKT